MTDRQTDVRGNNMSPNPKVGDTIMGEIITKQCWFLVVEQNMVMRVVAS